jgi:hypothetical protein
MKVAGCSKLSLHPLTGYWFRAVAALSAHPGLEGFVFPSSKSGNRNLAIFMDKLDKRSLITFENELDGKIERLI